MSSVKCLDDKKYWCTRSQNYGTLKNIFLPTAKTLLSAKPVKILLISSSHEKNSYIKFYKTSGTFHLLDHYLTLGQYCTKTPASTHLTSVNSDEVLFQRNLCPKRFFVLYPSILRNIFEIQFKPHKYNKMAKRSEKFKVLLFFERMKKSIQ